jgi:hypothetical protein
MKKLIKTPRPGAYYVTNENFRKWRIKYGNGKGRGFPKAPTVVSRDGIPRSSLFCMDIIIPRQNG